MTGMLWGFLICQISERRYRMKNDEHKKAMAKIDEFFDKEIHTKDFAQRMRSLMRATISMYLEREDCLWRTEIEDCYFLFTEFCECLHPVLSEEN